MIDGADGKLPLPAVAAAGLLFLCAESCGHEDMRGQSSGGDASVPPSPIASESIASEALVSTSPSGLNRSSRGNDISPMTSMHDDFVEKPHVGSFAWTDAQWHSHCRGVQTSYNPKGDLREDALTLRPSDPRWLDFVFWTLSNKVNEHQV